MDCRDVAQVQERPEPAGDGLYFKAGQFAHKGSPMLRRLRLLPSRSNQQAVPANDRDGRLPAQRPHRKLPIACDSP